MIPDDVLQERIDRALSRARPHTPEEEADDLELMERLYQEDLKRQSTTPGIVASSPAVTGDCDSAGPKVDFGTTPDT
jgi:hypothetical protein